MMCGDGLGALPTRALLAKNPHSTQNPKTWRTNLGGGHRNAAYVRHMERCQRCSQGRVPLVHVRWEHLC